MIESPFRDSLDETTVGEFKRSRIFMGSLGGRDSREFRGNRTSRENRSGREKYY
jgi:hypothetical protein